MAIDEKTLAEWRGEASGAAVIKPVVGRKILALIDEVERLRAANKACLTAIDVLHDHVDNRTQEGTKLAELRADALTQRDRWRDYAEALEKAWDEMAAARWSNEGWDNAKKGRPE